MGSDLLMYVHDQVRNVCEDYILMHTISDKYKFNECNHPKNALIKKYFFLIILIQLIR